MAKSAIVITGAAGRIGQAIQRLYTHAEGIDRDDVDLTIGVPSAFFHEAETVIHLAGRLEDDIDSAQSSLAMLFNVMRAATDCNVRRLIIASSVRADEPSVGFPVTFYGAGKAAHEAMLRAWVSEKDGRAAVAMRFGLFMPGGKADTKNEVLRLDEEGLAYWMSLAMRASYGRVTTLHAQGRLRSP